LNGYLLRVGKARHEAGDNRGSVQNINLVDQLQFLPDPAVELIAPSEELC
jgi:hypothetical protein